MLQERLGADTLDSLSQLWEYSNKNRCRQRWVNKMSAPGVSHPAVCLGSCWKTYIVGGLGQKCCVTHQIQSNCVYSERSYSDSAWSFPHWGGSSSTSQLHTKSVALAGRGFSLASSSQWTGSCFCCVLEGTEACAVNMTWALAAELSSHWHPILQWQAWQLQSQKGFRLWFIPGWQEPAWE